MMEIALPDRDQTIRPGKLICVGRNYARHAAEMKSEVPDQPILFLKPATALIGNGGVVVLPPLSHDVHHEVELVVLIGRQGKNISEKEALTFVAGYAAGLDMTARDLQAEAKKKGQPWSVAKGFDTFAPLGEFVSPSAVEDPQTLSIELAINGTIRQSGYTGDMIFSVSYLISYISFIFMLMPGDLLYTGTPEGVGPVHEGDFIEARIDGLPPLSVTIQQPS